VTVTPQTETVIEKLETAMRDADWEAIAETYAPDVLLDTNLPTWRFQLQGRDAVAQYLVEQTKGLSNLHTTQHRVFRTDDGVIIEEEMRFDGDDGEYLWRAVDVFHVDGASVVEHIQYCTGCWTPDQIARQGDEAPMVRW
jgi:predicted SnoaL-like aldol condensation-catalyzing enzyme